MALLHQKRILTLEIFCVEKLRCLLCRKGVHFLLIQLGLKLEQSGFQLTCQQGLSVAIGFPCALFLDSEVSENRLLLPLAVFIGSDGVGSNIAAV